MPFADSNHILGYALAHRTIGRPLLARYSPTDLDLDVIFYFKYYHLAVNPGQIVYANILHQKRKGNT